MFDDEERTRLVPLVVDLIGLLLSINDVPYLCIALTAGCDCHPEHTLMVERRHCLN